MILKVLLCIESTFIFRLLEIKKNPRREKRLCLSFGQEENSPYCSFETHLATAILTVSLMTKLLIYSSIWKFRN